MSKYQGREITTTIQAGNSKDLNSMISGLRLFAQSQGLGPIKVLEKGVDPDGGYEAIVRAHNWNPVSWVKDKISGDGDPDEEPLDDPEAAGVSEEYGLVPYQSNVPSQDYRSQGGWGVKQPLGDEEPVEAEFREEAEAEEEDDSSRREYEWAQKRYEEYQRGHQEDPEGSPSSGPGQEESKSWWERAKAHNQAKWEDVAGSAEEDMEEQGSFRERAQAKTEAFREKRARDAERAQKEQIRNLDIQMGVEGRKSHIRGLKQSHPGKSRAERFEKSANKYTGAMQNINKAIIPPINKRAMKDIYVGHKDPKGDVYIPRGMKSLTTPGTLDASSYYDAEGLKSLTKPGGALKRASTPGLGKLTSPTSSMGASMLGQAATPQPVGNFQLKKPDLKLKRFGDEDTLIGQMATGKIKPRKGNGAKNSYKKGTRMIKREERLY